MTSATIDSIQRPLWLRFAWITFSKDPNRLYSKVAICSAVHPTKLNYELHFCLCLMSSTSLWARGDNDTYSMNIPFSINCNRPTLLSSKPCETWGLKASGRVPTFHSWGIHKTHVALNISELKVSTTGGFCPDVCAELAIWILEGSQYMSQRIEPHAATYGSLTSSGPLPSISADCPRSRPLLKISTCI